MQKKLRFEHSQCVYTSFGFAKKTRGRNLSSKNDPPNFQVNLLSVILNDAPILPEEDDEDVALLVKDSPQCMTFGLFMIW